MNKLNRVKKERKETLVQLVSLVYKASEVNLELKDLKVKRDLLAFKVFLEVKEKVELKESKGNQV